APHDFAVAHHHGTNHGVRTGQSPALSRQVERFAHATGIHYSKIDSMNFSGSKGSRSSTFSPTPMYRIGKFNSRAIATTIPPFAVPSSLVRTMPVTPEVSVNLRACSSPFWPVVA